MILAFDILIFVILIATALLSLRVRDLLTAVALLASYSLFAALLFTGTLALDVALVEAALGAGLTGVLFIAAIMITTRKSYAREAPRHRVFVAVFVVAFLGLMLYASSGLPDHGDPAAPAHTGVATTYLERSMADTQTPNVVTALLADYRSQDTLGETLVIVTAALAAALVLMRRPGEREEFDDNDLEPNEDDALERVDHDPSVDTGGQMPEATDTATEGTANDQERSV